MDVPNPVDVDGGAEVEVGLDGGRDLGKERHPVFLISEDLTITFNHLHFKEKTLRWKIHLVPTLQSGALSVKISLMGTDLM